MNIDHWTKYWESGHPTTFGLRFRNGYEGAIRRHWLNCFDGVDEGGRILDIASGAGAVIRLARESARKREIQLQLFASDLAAFPGSHATQCMNDGIHFLGGTPSDAIPLPDASIDVIVSQYGLEYSNPKSTVTEVARILPAHGRFCAITHAEESVIVRDSRAMLRFLTWFTEELRIVDRLKLLAKRMGNVREIADIQRERSRRNVERERHELDLTMKQVLSLYPGETQSSACLQHYRDFFDPRIVQTMQSRLRHCAKLADENHKHVTRLEDLLSVVLGSDKRNVYTELFAGHGFVNVEWSPFCDDDGSVLGYRLDATR